MLSTKFKFFYHFCCKLLYLFWKYFQLEHTYLCNCVILLNVYEYNVCIFLKCVSCIYVIITFHVFVIGTVRANRVGIPSALVDTRWWCRADQGHLEWAMHSSWGMSSVMWKDKCLVLLLSTHALAVGLPSLFLPPKVPRRSGAMYHNIPTFPLLVEYTTYMCGVDVADQLRSSYTIQTKSHKWWHKIFNGLLDISTVNMYIMYLDRCKQRINPIPYPLTHLVFKRKLCEALLLGWLPVFFLRFSIYRPVGTAETYSKANSSRCWMTPPKRDENGVIWMKNGQNG